MSAYPIVYHHHERWDGQGYPDGLKGEKIPLGARIVAVMDAFDAMTTDRPYRAGMSFEEAVSIIKDGAGRQWDQRIVQVMLETINAEALNEDGHEHELASGIVLPDEIGKPELLS